MNEELINKRLKWIIFCAFFNGLWLAMGMSALSINLYNYGIPCVMFGIIHAIVGYFLTKKFVKELSEVKDNGN